MIALLLKLRAPFLLLVLIIIPARQVLAQEYFKRFQKHDHDGYYFAVSHLKVHSDGTYIRSILKGDTIVLEKYNACDSMLWSSGWISEYSLSFLSMKLTAAGNPLIVARGYKDGEYHLLITSFSTDGQSVVWNKRLSYNLPPSAMQVEQGDDGILWIMGSVGTQHICLIKMDDAGNILLSVFYDEIPSVWSQHFSLIEDSGCLIINKSNLLRIDSTGAVVWKVQYPDLHLLMGAVPIDEGFLISAHNLGNVTNTFKVDGSGNVISNRTTASNFFGITTRKYPDGRILCMGFNELVDSTGNRATAPSIMQLDSNGRFIRNVQVGIDAVNGLLGQARSAELHNGSLIVDGTTSKVVNGNFTHSRMLARMTMDPEYFLCGDTAEIVTSQLAAVTKAARNPPTVTPFTFEDTSFTWTPVAISQLPITECSAENNYTNLFPTDSLLLCQPDSIDLLDPDLNPESLWWSNGNSRRVIYADTPGTYVLAVTFPCDPRVYYDSVEVVFEPEPVHHISVSPPEVEVHEWVKFSYTSNNPADAVTWYFGDGTEEVSNITEHSYPKAGTYPITIRVQTAGGCVYEYYDTVKVHFGELVIPNIFSPNGDGINDLMTITGGGIDFQVELYNRNGTLVRALQGQPWDGTTSSGGQAADGVYFYLIRYTLSDGSFAAKKGTITLVRNGR